MVGILLGADVGIEVGESVGIGVCCFIGHLPVNDRINKMDTYQYITALP